MGSFAETLPSLALARPGLDRQADRRLDPDLIGSLLSAPTTRVVELFGDQVAVDTSGPAPVLALRAPRTDEAERADGADGADGEQSQDSLVVFLGVDGGGVAYLAVVHPPRTEASPREAGEDGLRSLRQVGADLTDRDAALFTTALALGNWHAAHGFCPRCGAPTEPVQAGWLRRCTREGSEHYPRTDPAVIMSVVDPQDRLLMARGKGWGPGRFSVLAGFVEPGESLAAAVAREVREEVGLEVEDIRYLGDQPWPFPTSLMVGFTARALSTDVRLQESELVEARWFTREELLAAVAAGTLGLSPRLSISRRLLEHWLGHEIAGAR